MQQLLVEKYFQPPYDAWKGTSLFLQGLPWA